jgi:hypothetical protein
VIGQAAAALGHTDAAEAALTRALETAEDAGLPAPAWEAHASLAALLDVDGRSGEADHHAGRARQILGELGLQVSEVPV